MGLRRLIPLKGRWVSSLVKEAKKLTEKSVVKYRKRITPIDKELIKRLDKMRQKSKLSKREQRNFRLIQDHRKKMTN
ncbi:MAG: hypothetical protein ABID38_06625 [Candidatus Diapherotrites archaeon]